MEVNAELVRAQDLLADIEDALDARDAEIQQKRDLEERIGEEKSLRRL